MTKSKCQIKSKITINKKEVNSNQVEKTNIEYRTRNYECRRTVRGSPFKVHQFILLSCFRNFVVS